MMGRLGIAPTEFAMVNRPSQSFPLPEAWPLSRERQKSPEWQTKAALRVAA